MRNISVVDAEIAEGAYLTDEPRHVFRRQIFGQGERAAHGVLHRRLQQLGEGRDALLIAAIDERSSAISEPALITTPRPAAAITIAPMLARCGGVVGSARPRRRTSLSDRESRQGPGGQGDGRREDEPELRLDDAGHDRGGDDSRDRAGVDAPGEGRDHDRERGKIGKQHRDRRSLNGDDEQEGGGQPGSQRMAMRFNIGLSLSRGCCG